MSVRVLTAVRTVCKRVRKYTRTVLMFLCMLVAALARLVAQHLRAKRRRPAGPSLLPHLKPSTQLCLGIARQ